MHKDPLRLSSDEMFQLRRAEAQGASSASIYREGVFSAPDFIAFGVLERLVIRGLLVRTGLERVGSNVTYTYDLAAPSGGAVTLLETPVAA